VALDDDLRLLSLSPSLPSSASNFHSPPSSARAAGEETRPEASPRAREAAPRDRASRLVGLKSGRDDEGESDKDNSAARTTRVSVQCAAWRVVVDAGATVRPLTRNLCIAGMGIERAETEKEKGESLV